MISEKDREEIRLHAKIHVLGAKRGINFIELADQVARSTYLKLKDIEREIRIMIDYNKVLKFDERWDIKINDGK